MRNKKIVKLLSIFILLALIIGSIAVEPISINAAKGESQVTNEVTYDIAVVFDNSGSMYKGNRWRYAKYALGVFASMLDYSKDKLTVFSMWEITSNSGKNNNSDRVEISSLSDIDKIKYIFTPAPRHTPIEVCDRAKKYLTRSEKKEKWLVILTDGGFTKEVLGKTKSDDNNAKEKLSGYATRDVKVHFLSFGKDKKTYGVANDITFFEHTANGDAGVKDELIKICNSIFKRDELKLNNNFLNNKTNNFELDVSSRRLLVFDQGENSNIELFDSNNQKISPASTPMNIQADKDEKYSAGGNYKAIVKNNLKKAKNLKGTIVEFKPKDGFKKGKYILKGYSKKVKVFYEPDVSIPVYLEKNGKKLTQEDVDRGVEPGDYRILYELIDNGTGEKVSDKANLKQKINAYVNGDEKEYKNGELISLEPDQDINIEAKGYYQVLTGDDEEDKDPKRQHPISSEENGDGIGLNLKGIKILSEKDNYKIKINVQQIARLYTLMEHDSWKPIVISVTKDGKKLSENELKNVKISFSEKIPFFKKINTKNSTYEIEIGRDKNGNYVEPAEGNYSIKASIADDNKLRVNGDSKEAHFIVTPLPAWVIWTIIALIVLLIVALILWWFSRKVLPKNLNVDQSGTSYLLNYNPVDMLFDRARYSRKHKTLSISSPPGLQVPVAVNCKLKAIDRRWTKSKNRRMIVEPIGIPNADLVKIASNSYQYEEGILVKKPNNSPIISNSVITLEKTDMNGNEAIFNYKIRRL